MRTDGTFKTKHVSLPEWKSGERLVLIPFGDIHRDSPGFSDDAWDKFLTRCRTLIRQKQKVLFLGMGDYLDSYSTSERVIMYSSGLHESSTKNHAIEAKRKVEALAREIEFMRGRMIGFMGGNHFPMLEGRISGDQHLAAMLGTDYLGACCAMRISFGVHRSSCISFDIFAHHGKGGGTTAAGKFNAVEKLQSVCDADIFLMGDNHARGCFPAGEKLRLRETGGKLYVKSKPTWIGRTGSFLRAYVEDEPSYVVDAALSPANLGHVEFNITPRRVRTGGIDILELEIGATQ